MRLAPLVAALFVLAAPVARAQQASLATRPPADTVPLPVLADSAVRELERAMSVLAASVERIVTETANKPEVRLAAVQVAGRAVSLAQQAVVQHTSEIERLLAEAGRLLERAERAQREKVAKP